MQIFFSFLVFVMLLCSLFLISWSITRCWDREIIVDSDLWDMYSFHLVCFLFLSFDVFVCSVRAARRTLSLSLSLAFSFIFIRNNYNKNKRTPSPMTKRRAKTIERAHYPTRSLWKSALLVGNDVPTIITHTKTDPDYYLFHSKQIN